MIEYIILFGIGYYLAKRTNKNNHTGGSFSHLPAELNEQILFRLGINDIVNLCKINKVVYHFCNDDLFWKRYINYNNIDILDLDLNNLLILFNHSQYIRKKYDHISDNYYIKYFNNKYNNPLPDKLRLKLLPEFYNYIKLNLIKPIEIIYTHLRKLYNELKDKLEDDDPIVNYIINETRESILNSMDTKSFQLGDIRTIEFLYNEIPFIFDEPYIEKILEDAIFSVDNDILNKLLLLFSNSLDLDSVENLQEYARQIIDDDIVINSFKILHNNQ